jgi:hypothetical protein
MTEVRRNSRGDVLGPRPYDPRSYDEKQAPKVTTHTRHASATGAATASKTRDRLSVAYRDSAERGVHRKNPATHKMNEL